MGMKPAWDKLMGEFEGHASALVADVDCTAAGEDLCSTVGVKGYPTIKWGDPSNLEDYEGGRDYDDLKKFADENLKPVCSPANLDLCSDDQKAEIKKFTDMSDAELDEAIKGKEKEQDETLANIKKSGLGTMKAVKASR